MEAIIQSAATLFWALGFLLFFGPIIIIVSLIGKLQLGFINVDLSGHSKLSRLILALLGIGIWLAVYIPVVSFAYKTLPPTTTALPPTMPVSTQTLQIAETATVSTTILPTQTDLPAIISSPTPTTTNNSDPKFLVITEVLGNPCGRDSRNEFIEIYNSGNNPIDIGGFWITDGDEADKIVSWQVRYPSIKIGYLTKTDTTLIPAHSYAVILAPGYPFVQKEYVMPYIFPENTLILTVEKGQLLGDEIRGIEVSNRDVIVLYQGTESTVDKIISSYGSPIMSSSPTSIKDNGTDEIPFNFDVDECWSAERILAVNEDVASNWRKIFKSSPGSGNYP